MVETLKCARSFWHGGFIASYSDIVFKPEMLRQVELPSSHFGYHRQTMETLLGTEVRECS